MDGLSKNDIIKINVGGQLYMTTFHSICRYRNSYLYELICEKLKDSSGDNLQNREIFIDRNGKRFEYILDFLRDGVLICKNDINLLAKILIEAIYFKIVALIKILKKKIHLLYSKIDSSVNRKILKSIFSAIEKEKITDNETRKQFLNESNILTNPLAEYEKLKALKLKRKKKRYTNIMEIHNVKNIMGLNEDDNIIDESKNIRIKKKEREELDSSPSEKTYRSDEELIHSSDLNESEKETHSQSGYHSDQLEEMIQMHGLAFDKAHLNVTTQINNLNDHKKRNCVVPTGNIIVYDDVNDIEETAPPPMVSNVNLGEQIFSTTVDF